MILRGAYNIENCQIIEYVIRLLDKISVVGKQGYRSSREYEWIEEQIQIIFQNEVIKESSSLYVFNVVVVGKKNSIMNPNYNPNR